MALEVRGTLGLGVLVAAVAVFLTGCGESGSTTASSATESGSGELSTEAAAAEPVGSATVGSAAEPAPAESASSARTRSVNLDLLDPELPEYAPVDGVAGKIKSIGSDTMNNIMTYWAEAFQGFYPSVQPEITGKGSSTAPPALAQGQAQFGPMSRSMKQAEEQAFEEVHGYKPVQLRTGVDCLVVYVHKDNPLDAIALEDVRRAFSVDGPASMTWGDLGVTDPTWASRRIDLYGRNSASGTYGFFKEVALSESDYKATVKEQPGSSAVVQAIGRDPFAMGYSGLGYRTQDVKPLSISVGGGSSVVPSAATAYAGDYPLARYLYVYVAADPRRELDPLRAEFIRLIFSRQGQESVLKDGYFPVSAAFAQEQLEALGISG